MPTKVVDTILPTTMIGSYPKARWSTRYNLAGADILEWWKLEENWHARWDATTACIKDQELAGLDIVTDGQMHFDDYGGGIGSFVWYWYERLGGFTKAKLPNPLARAIEQGDDPDMSQVAWMHNWGGTAVTGEVSQGIPGRLGEMYEAAVQLTDRPLKVSVGAGPPNLTFHVDYNAPGSKYSSAQALAEDLVPIFNTDLKDLVARGATYIQIEDLGAWRLDFEEGSEWVIDVLNAWIDGVDAKIAWRCLGTGYGNTFRSVEDADVRTLYIESDDEIVERIHKVLEHISPEQVYLSTDCGLKALPRFCAFEKLKALTRAAERVRQEIGSSRQPTLAAM